MNQRQRQETFARYIRERFDALDAITPGQKIEVVAQMREEARGHVTGHPHSIRLPKAGGGSILLPKDHELVRAALEGRRVSMGGTTIESAATSASYSERMEALPTPAKVGLLALIGLAPLLFILLFMGFLGGDAEAAEAPTVTTTVEASPTATELVEVTPAEDVVVVVTPSAAPVLPTATPYAIALGVVGGEAARSANDPASIEVAGYTWVLAAGEVLNGQWLPVGAEWLAGTELRRVVAVPYEADVAEAVSNLRGGEVLRLRLRSGEIVKYRIADVRRQQRQEIEVLAERSPSLVLLLHSEPSAERWVVVAEAVQQPQEFTLYTAGVAGIEAESVATPYPTLVPGTTPDMEPSEVITTTRTITSEATGLRLEVGRCQRAAQVGDEEAPSKQEFMSCNVTLTALDGHVSVPFSADALAVTEEEWITENIDWWPPAVSVTRALSSGGTLTAGSSTSGRIAGLVARRSGFGSGGQPVVVWEQAGTRYLIEVDADAP